VTSFWDSGLVLIVYLPGIKIL